MSLNIEGAFSYPVKDSGWKKKCLIGALLMVTQVIGQALQSFSQEISEYFKKVPHTELSNYVYLIPLILILALLIIVFGFFTSGYFAKNANLRILHPESALPEWKDWNGYFFIGLKQFAAIGIYTIVLLLVIAIAAGLLFAAKAPGLAISIVCLLLVLPLFIAYAITLGIANMAFLTDLKFASFFNFKLMGNLIKNNTGEFFIVLLLNGGLSMMYSVVSGLLTLTIVGIVLLPLISFYQFLIAGDLSAQFIRNSINKFDTAKKAAE